MKANMPDIDMLDKVKPPRDSDGKLLIMTSPRCKAYFSDGGQCKRPACRLDHTNKLVGYSAHCSMHGGKQEVSAYQRTLAQSAMHSTVEQQHNILSTELACHDSTTSNDSTESSTGHLHSTTNPNGTGGMVPQETTSIDGPISRGGGGCSEKSVLKIESSNQTEKAETLYTVPDATLRKSFNHKLNHGQMNLNEELALVRMLIQQIVKSMSSGNLTAEVLSKLDKLMGRADKILNTIHRIEDTRKVQYTRESLRMDVMKVVAVIRRIVPEEPRRREFATELAKILGPAMAESGDIIVSREVFRKG